MKSKSEKTNRIAKDGIVIDPGDLIHVDQEESSTPDRPLIYSDKNNKKKYSLCPCL